MIDLRLFRQRAFSAPVLSAMLCYASLSATFLLPFALIQGRGLSPAQVGLILTCQPVVMAITASISGSLSDRIGSRAPATAGLLIVSVALFLLSHLQARRPSGRSRPCCSSPGWGSGSSPRPTAAPSWGPSRPSAGAWPTASWGRRARWGWCWGSAWPGPSTPRPSALAGAPGPEAILGAAGAGLLVGSGIALLGALASATRPVQDAPGAA